MEDWKQEWLSKREGLKKENKKYLQKLRKTNKKTLDHLADQLHQEAFRKVDCLKCANCCTSIPPIVNKTDEARLAKHLGMKAVDFRKQYLLVDEDGDTVMNTSPCVFLQKDNTCLVYEHRPKACREYPHTDNYEFVQNIKLHGENAFYCPAVHHILERLKGFG